jgi:hypothetical protein
VALLLLGALAVGVALGFVMRSTLGPRRTGEAVPTRSPGGPSDDAGLAALSEAAIHVRDRVGNRVLADRLAEGLRAAGWTPIEPEGDRFDPAHHTWVDREPTDDPALDGTIAAVERSGYRDRSGTLVRQPEVVVYRFVPGGSA